MKICLLILLLFVGNCAFSQLNDNFADGDFSNNPVWKGDINGFIVTNQGELQTSSAAESRSVSLSTASNLASSVSWEFFIRLDFDPSASNRLRIYLLSDKEDMKGPLQGYFIQIGETGNSDSYDLYRQSGTTVTKIIDGPDQVRLNTDKLICRLQITRDSRGLWQLNSDKTGGFNFIPEGTVIDDTFIQSGWFGIVCQYTATRSDKFFLDDFKIQSWQDNKPAYAAQPNDIVINEILADPEPAVNLPEAEFVELWNRSTENVSLKNWTYSDGTGSFKFSDDNIKAGELLILCARGDTAKFKRFGRVLGISPWPSLNNSGDHLSLKDPNSRLINEVIYSDTWYQDTKKKGGGWTLEMIDDEAVCGGIRNWLASKDTLGGTPGRKNSVYKLYANSDPLKVTRLTMQDSISLALIFNRYTDSLAATDPKNYTLNNGVRPLTAQYSIGNPLMVILKFAEPLARGNLYKVTIDKVTDCSGTLITAALNSAELMLPGEAVQGDILISEVLFNPRSGGVDFVEIYNNSAEALDMSELSIGNIPLPDSLNRAKRLGSEQFLLKPGEYLTLTSDPEKVKNEYFTRNPDSFLKISPFPAYNNDEGLITILRNKQLIDQFAYTEKMHSPIIKDAEGVSLERSDFTRQANDPGNFKSAAAAFGFATPGYRNSAYMDASAIKDEFNLFSSTFSPDNDGFEDLMQINYNLSKSDYIANITIYNSHGNTIRKLYKNFTLGTQGTIEWDGRDDSMAIRSEGVYLLLAELFTTNGETRKFRKTIVLARKFN